MSQFDGMSLDDLIELYAHYVLTSGMYRVQIHDVLCKRLGFDHVDFRPFEDDYFNDLPRLWELSQEQRAAFLRRKIREFKARYGVKV